MIVEQFMKNQHQNLVYKSIQLLIITIFTLHFVFKHKYCLTKSKQRIAFQ